MIPPESIRVPVMGHISFFINFGQRFGHGIVKDATSRFSETWPNHPNSRDGIVHHLGEGMGDLCITLCLIFISTAPPPCPLINNDRPLMAEFLNQRLKAHINLAWEESMRAG